MTIGDGGMALGGEESNLISSIDYALINTDITSLRYIYRYFQSAEDKGYDSGVNYARVDGLSKSIENKDSKIKREQTTLQVYGNNSNQYNWYAINTTTPNWGAITQHLMSCDTSYTSFKAKCGIYLYHNSIYCGGKLYPKNISDIKTSLIEIKGTVTNGNLSINNAETVCNNAFTQLITDNNNIFADYTYGGLNNSFLMLIPHDIIFE
jgi:hypothetical protein